MKIYIVTDMEGVAGIARWDTPAHNSIDQQQEKWMTLEVQAAIEGAKSAGADEIIVAESHRLDIDLLDEDIKIVVAGGYSLDYMPGVDNSVDAVMIIGQHAKSGVSNGVLNHTGNSTTLNLSLNNVTIGECGFAMAYASSFGVPTIFVSGDKAVSEEAEKLAENIVTVSVKEGINKYHAISLHPVKARKLIKEGVSKAIKQKNQIGSFKPSAPYELKVEFSTTQTASKMARVPGITRINDRTVSYKSNDFNEIAAIYRLRGALYDPK